MQQRTAIVSCLAVLAFIVVMGCSAAPLQDRHGKEFYTQVGLWAQGGQHETTNYKSGRFIPANTRVVLISSTNQTISFRVPSMGDYTVRMVNKRQYSGEDIKGIFNRTLGKDKVNLEKYSEETYQAIRNGEIKTGMSKQAVILARGYPPSHQTPKLGADKWKYWNSRFGTINVYFENGKVSKIEE